MLFEKGKLEKMTITALKYPPSVNGKVGKPTVVKDKSFTVQVNPASYSLNKRIRYQEIQPPGSGGSPQKHVYNNPSTLSFEIIFDGTGVISEESLLDQVPAVGAVVSLLSKQKKFVVEEQVKVFEDLVYYIDGDIHQPNKVRIVWGKLTFDGSLTTANYDYTLFNPDGSPLRVKVNCSFAGTVMPQDDAAKTRKSSADLTHIRELTQGDTLPLLADKVYGNPGLYIEVARVNKLINFRRLAPGQRIVLPPLDKSAKQ